ncbi:hypothetical protein BU26DRAFT_512935 [Trematosphaeria pertusa]|uniref:18S rRNA factor 2 n=1 Tax=Trematosphaeria pertusa TaxID=390896 RepID=A0A6A6IZK1_9PLEO|nr:uncharacterized protein BU26DRAFT_512935 [Trematosphaeria pertusa]KAF2256031.1 hypothetical protein BU26DRAFT_512935 [Trematosphaeria pertusa]
MLASSKRQKTTHESEDEDAEDDLEDEDDEVFEDAEDQLKKVDRDAELARLQNLAANLPSDLKLQSGKLRKPLPLSAQPKKDKSGVVYLSRVPPFMKPSVMRSLLTSYGEIGRIFLTPESSTQRQQRLKSGGTKRKLYLDGWVEFLSKKDAKFVAESLNAQTMGGKKRSRWHDEVWNIKYLSGVKWTHLVEQIQNENAERAARLRFEIAQSKKENKRFLENVEKGKMISGIEAKRKRKGMGDDEDDDEDADVVEKTAKKDKRRVKFEQNEVRTKALKKPEPGQDVHKVLSSIF